MIAYVSKRVVAVKGYVDYGRCLAVFGFSDMVDELSTADLRWRGQLALLEARGNRSREVLKRARNWQ